jgi:hypothetical protein
MAWQPQKNSIIRDSNIQASIHEVGYKVAGNIGLDLLSDLTRLYGALHAFKPSEGGMFYSLYSNDIEYREKVHLGIENILKPIFDNLFNDYKTVINSFIVKIPGPKSDFTLHQDSTGLDEFKYSPLSAWIPLQDTDLSNGTLCIIPKTHGFFSPYRGISFSPPFAQYEAVLRKYLIPVDLKAGDILLFDNRLVHYSHLNSSNQERRVVMSGIFPSEAEILSVYKDESILNAPLEIYKQSDDFLITNTAFYENCTARPYRGEVIKKVYDLAPQKTVYDFLSWTSREGVKATDIAQLTEVNLSMQIVSEPV